jgi:hypothetical protein
VAGDYRIPSKLESTDLTHGLRMRAIILYHNWCKDYFETFRNLLVLGETSRWSELTFGFHIFAFPLLYYKGMFQTSWNMCAELALPVQKAIDY